MISEKFIKYFKERMIPMPVSFEFTDMELLPLQENASLLLVSDRELFDRSAELIKNLAWKYWKWQPEIQWGEPEKDKMIPEEGYNLVIEGNTVMIRAFDQKGIRYALNTLRQL